MLPGEVLSHELHMLPAARMTAQFRASQTYQYMDGFMLRKFVGQVNVGQNGYCFQENVVWTRNLLQQATFCFVSEADVWTVIISLLSKMSVGHGHLSYRLALERETGQGLKPPWAVLIYWSISPGQVPYERKMWIYTQTLIQQLRTIQYTVQFSWQLVLLVWWNRLLAGSC